MAAANAGWVAAHNADTAWAGEQVLADGGSAADAAVAMTLATCVVEPLVVSLLSGMHGIHTTHCGTVLGIDGFVDIPRVTAGGQTVETTVVFAEEAVPYTIGGATFGTPGLVAGCGLLHRRHGHMPWSAVVEPAIVLARQGFTLGPEDAVLLQMLEGVMTLGVGASVFLREDGTLKGEGDGGRLPDIGDLLSVLAAEGPGSMYTGAIAAELARFCQDVGALVDIDDLAAFDAEPHTPPAVRIAGHTVRTRVGLSPLTAWLDNLSRIPVSDVDVATLAAVQSPAIRKAMGTTSLAVCDVDGNGCAVTASLGLGTGDWFYGSQLNSMLGEVDLQQGQRRPRSRMGSMMAPTVIHGRDGTVAVLGAAGGSRIPSALLRTIDGIVRLGLPPSEAVDLPRIHRSGMVAHVEPHLPDTDMTVLAGAGFDVRRWTTRHHYFGGVSIAGPAGAQGDRRRGGAALRAG